MSSQFVKFFPSVMEATQNLIQSSIIMLIVSKAKGKRNCTMQKTWIAKKLCLTARTITNNIKALEQMGLIKTETTCIAVNGEPKTTTHFFITEKLLKLIGAEEKENSQPSKPSTTSFCNDVEKPIERKQQKAKVKNMYDVYDEIIAKMTKEGLA